MGVLWAILVITQLLFTVAVGIYIFSNMRNHQKTKTTININFKKEIEQMRKLRNIRLNNPLSEKSRPIDFSEVIGQEKGIKALKAALCGESPQHVIIYGPPGVGKTSAARLALKSAILSKKTPFKKDASFIEMDATILQFDERSIADPLIGSVHDPIYQGAGAYGMAGIPSPKAGAVTKAHGGVLFIDEIGELSQLQMNRLLKVLEDRKVILTSSYYSAENNDIPKHIHDIFQNGYPADFRLIGTTTRQPEELPPALRSRCFEVFFRGLKANEISTIAENALNKSGYSYDPLVLKNISEYSSNGRDTINIIQMVISLVELENRTSITVKDLEEAVEYGRYKRTIRKKVSDKRKVGVINGLAVNGALEGSILEIEVISNVAKEKGSGVLKVTGIVEEEELNGKFSKIKRTSRVKNSVDNVVTLIEKITCKKITDYDIHLNFPGGGPVDGPSAGSAIFLAIYSSLTRREIPQNIAITGELSIKGKIKPVGGIVSKIEAGIEAGVEKIIIPVENYQEQFKSLNIRIVKMDNIYELIEYVFNIEKTIELTTGMVNQFQM